jgi:DNA-binding CsgD family transcriptional regulator
VKALLFFESPTIAAAFSRSLSSADLECVPGSSVDNVEGRLDTGTIDVIVVPTESVESWWEVEGSIGPQVVVPRVLTAFHETDAAELTDDYTEALGFDGFTTGQPSMLPVWFAAAVSEASRCATSRGARSAPRPHVLTARPSRLSITLGEPLNEEILALILAGFSDQEIAGAVFLAVQTVRNRVHAMLTRARARNRTHLATIYLRLLWRERS